MLPAARDGVSHAHCAKILVVDTTWRFLQELLQLEALRRGSLTVLIASALRSCRIRLDRARSRRGLRAPEASKAFADGPPAIVRVEQVARPSEPMKQLGVGTVVGAAWTHQAVSEQLRALTGGQGAEIASEAPYGAVSGHTGIQAGAAPGFELEVRDPVVFTVSLKVRGVEKGRAEAKARP